ncbi:MAG: hypothetical protein GXO43_06880 [Crenarchaeota archaeon]|nr:hypothetical protein [Thermoproteota archaeon]
MINPRTLGLTCLAIAFTTPFLIIYNLGADNIVPYTIGYMLSFVLGTIIYVRLGFDTLQFYGISTLVLLITIMIADHTLFGVVFAYGMILAYLTVSGSHLLKDSMVKSLEAEK